MKTKSHRRIDIVGLLNNPVARKKLMIESIYAIQLREDPTMTIERAKYAYFTIQQRASLK